MKVTKASPIDAQLEISDNAWTFPSKEMACKRLCLKSILKNRKDICWWKIRKKSYTDNSSPKVGITWYGKCECLKWGALLVPSANGELKFDNTARFWELLWKFHRCSIESKAFYLVARKLFFLQVVKNIFLNNLVPILRTRKIPKEALADEQKKKQ